MAGAGRILVWWDRDVDQAGGRFDPTCDWPAMKFGNKPVSGPMFFSLIMAPLPN